MDRTLAVALVIAATLLTPTGETADLSGALLYDDQPVATVFPDITVTVAYANPWDPGDLIYGTVDLATSTYSISGLAPGRWGISIFLDRTDPPSDVGNAGDLQGYVNVDVSDPGDTVEQDLDIWYNYHVVSPIDSDLPLDGMGLDCTAYPAVAYPITFAIEPVPRAIGYTINTSLSSCPGSSIGFIEIESDVPSAEIGWGTAGEDAQQLWARCFGATGKSLCGGPTFRYTDSGVWALFLRNQDASGRAVHRTDAVVIPAVASTPGAHGTFWTSAVSVVNLLDVDRTIEVFYTPRDSDGLDDFASTTVTVPASSQVDWSDVMDELFSTAGAGALELRGHQLAVTSRTSTPGADGGSYGQGIPPLQPTQVLRLAGPATATIGGVEEGPTFRTNLGLCEVWGEGVTVRVAILDDTMTELGHREYHLRPYENTQINQVVPAVAGTGALSGGVASITVTSGSGRVGAYLSVVDNATGDPTFIAIAPQSPAGS